MERKKVMEFNPWLGSVLAKAFEGYRAKTYVCPAGFLTIGWGHTKGVKAGMTITEKQADAYLLEDLIEKQAFLASLVTVPVTEGEFVALLDFVFNIKASSVKSGRIPKLMNEGQTGKVADLLTQYCLANGKPLLGLKRRRFAEREIFLNGVNADWQKWKTATSFPTLPKV